MSIIKEVVNKVKCIEAKIINDEKPYLYCRYLVNDKFIYTFHRISLDGLNSINLETDSNGTKNCNLEIQLEANKDSSLFTIEKIYAVDEELKIFYENKIHEVKVKYVTTCWDSKELKTKLRYGLIFTNKTNILYGASLQWTEETLKQNEVL